MAFELSDTYGWITDELSHRRPVAEAMQRLIGLCEQARPHRDWSRFAALPYDDLSQLRQWLERLFRDEPAAQLLSGLWFGLFNPESAADIYVSGSERFYPVPGDNSWAVGAEWWPNGRCAEPGVLAEIYRIAYESDETPSDEPSLGNDAEYPLCLGYAAFAVQALLTEVDAAAILRGSPSLGVAVGFDSGDFILLGQLTPDGLRPVERLATAPELSPAEVRERLRSPSRKIVWRGLLDLDRLGARVQEIVPDLLHLASAAPEFGVRQRALSMMAEHTPGDPRVKLAVLQALEDQDPSVRWNALNAVINVQNLTANDLERIKLMENDPDESVAEWSEIALENILSRQREGPDQAEEESDQT